MAHSGLSLMLPPSLSTSSLLTCTPIRLSTRPSTRLLQISSSDEIDHCDDPINVADLHSHRSQSVGWTEEWVKHLEYISKIDISHDAPYRQRLRYESTIYMRGVDSNKQAGPPCQRPDDKSSADALVSLERAQGRGVPQIPTHLRARQNNT